MIIDDKIEISFFLILAGGSISGYVVPGLKGN